MLTADVTQRRGLAFRPAGLLGVIGGLAVRVDPVASSAQPREAAQVLRHCRLDGTDHESHEAQAFLLRRSIARRSRHAQDRMPREVVRRADVA